MSVSPLSSTFPASQSRDFSPRPVTRGESQDKGTHTCIDWLTATFKKPEFTVQFLIGLLADYFNCDLRGIDSGKGIHGFETVVSIEASINDRFKEVGRIAFGGSSQKGRWMLDIQGSGCGLVSDWESIQDLLESLDARITRCDLAADFLQGEKTVDDAVEMFRAGEFTMNGRPPQTDTQGDWLMGERGRTLYVGKRQNGKQLCIYEKGKQLGDLESSWTRYELRLGNRDREIPLDIITSPDKYFAGAYPALQSILSEIEGERIDTISKEAHISLVQLFYHAKRCYGKFFGTVQNLDGYSTSDMIESITISGIPNRLEPASINSDVNWDTLKDGLKQFEAHQ